MNRDQALLAQADVLITDRDDAQLRALGLDALAGDDCPDWPRLIRIHITPWGRHGPIRHYQGSELTAQAMAGYTRYLGRHGEPSLRLGADVASTGTGVFATQDIDEIIESHLSGGTPVERLRLE